MTTTIGSHPTTLSVSNFGPISQASIELRPLSVLIGPSNTGKSYLAVLIYALHRFLATYSSDLRSYGRFPGRRSEPRMRQSSRVEDYGLSSEEVESILEWATEMNLDQRNAWNQLLPSSELPETIALHVRSALKGIDQSAEALDEEIARCFGVEGSSALIRHPYRGESKISLVFPPARVRDQDISFRYDAELSEDRARIDAFIPDDFPMQIGTGTRIRDVAPTRWRFAGGINRGAETERSAAEVVSGLSGAVISGVADYLAGTAYYLPADRAGVMHAHRVVVRSLIARASRAGLRREVPLPALSGVLGDFLEQLVDMADVPSRFRRSSNGLSTHLEETMLRGSVLLEQRETDYPSFVYRPQDWKRDLPLMNASSMVSEMAPVVLYLRYIVEPGDLLIIEEPESHLHPEMQVAFTRQLASVVKSGIRVIITTHSEWVLEELANLVLLSELPEHARGDIPGSDLALTPEEVGAWLFNPNTAAGGSVVEEIRLDKDSGTFPARYGVVTEDLYNRFATISNRIEEL